MLPLQHLTWSLALSRTLINSVVFKLWSQDQKYQQVWELVRSAHCLAPLRPTDSETLELGPAICALISPSEEADTAKVWQPRELTEDLFLSGIEICNCRSIISTSLDFENIALNPNTQFII